MSITVNSGIAASTNVVCNPKCCASRGAKSVASTVPEFPAPAMPITRPCCSGGYHRLARGSATPKDRKSTRLNSSHGSNSYADFCLKKKTDERCLRLARVNKPREVTHILVQRCDDDALPVAERFEDVVFFFNDTATTEIYTLSLHDALPI